MDGVSSVVTDRDVAGDAAIADPELLLPEFLEWLVTVASASPRTVKTYRSALLDFVRRIGVQDLRRVQGETIERYRGRLFLAGLSESTRQMRGQSAPRKFFGWLVRRGHVPIDPMKNLLPMKVRFMERIPVLSRAEVARLTFRCPPTPPPVRGRREPSDFFLRRYELHNLVELRDPALIGLSYDLALRGGEPSLLERRDYDEVRGEVDIRGAKWQSEPVSFPVMESTKVAMALYLDALRRSRWSESAALFPALSVRRKDSKRPASGIGHYEVYRIFKRRVERVGIQARGRRLSPHILRYSRATHWKEDGVPIEDISALMRHSKIETVRRYLRLGPLKRVKRRADRRHLFRRSNFELPAE
jgi:site-specific recombinase XerD